MGTQAAAVMHAVKGSFLTLAIEKSRTCNAARKQILETSQPDIYPCPSAEAITVLNQVTIAWLA